jgi:hypothetical protein
MKIKFILVSLLFCMGVAIAGANLSGCSAGGHIGPVGGSASVG